MDAVRNPVDALYQLAPYLDSVQVCKYHDSKAVSSHKLEQLSKKEISEHARVYSKALKNKKIPYSIIG